MRVAVITGIDVSLCHLSHVSSPYPPIIISSYPPSPLLSWLSPCLQKSKLFKGGSSGVGFNATKKLVQRGIFCIIGSYAFILLFLSILLLIVLLLFTQASRNTSNVNIAVEQIKHETKLYVTATLFSIFLASHYSHFFFIYSPF